MSSVTPPTVESKVEPPDAADTAVLTDLADTRGEQARQLIRRQVYWSLGLGAIPIPFVDAAGVLASQLKMIRDLSQVYGVEFSESRSRAIVGSLIAALGAQTLSYAFVASVFKLVPALGPAFGLVAMPIAAAALTQTVGNVFMMHFESGGTLLNFDAVAMRDHFRQEFARNKLVVEEIRRGKPSQSGSKRPFTP
ncbi:YcjF family protein [Nannocystis punicea]|uniref:YcjF family protein n=1 Tax=Nannocystis punicea TaxID=2995304 RepID=A0ABY7GX98_9BACT|nr:YcjF family protein [Nannocystis poenicansa]WAS91505.1 YcjF family protein [Nannocystis poenicansa]